MAWFDSKSTGDFTNRLASDVNLIQDGISEKMGLILQYVASFISGFTIAYVRGPKLAGVLTAVTPLLAGAVFVMSRLLSKKTESEQGEYAAAGTIAQQTLSSMRTVAAFGGEPIERGRYKKAIQLAQNSGIKKSFINGIGIGSFQGVIFLIYALAFGYGSTLVPAEMTPGELLNVFFGIFIGAISLGNAFPFLVNLF